MSLQKNGPALIPRAPLRRPKMGDVFVAHWWTKVLASDFGVITCFGGLQRRLQSVLRRYPRTTAWPFGVSTCQKCLSVNRRQNSLDKKSKTCKYAKNIAVKTRDDGPAHRIRPNSIFRWFWGKNRPRKSRDPGDSARSPCCAPGTSDRLKDTVIVCVSLAAFERYVGWRFIIRMGTSRRGVDIRRHSRVTASGWMCVCAFVCLSFHM